MDACAQSTVPPQSPRNSLRGCPDLLSSAWSISCLTAPPSRIASADITMRLLPGVHRPTTGSPVRGSDCCWVVVYHVTAPSDPSSPEQARVMFHQVVYTAGGENCSASDGSGGPSTDPPPHAAIPSDAVATTTTKQTPVR